MDEEELERTLLSRLPKELQEELAEKNVDLLRAILGTNTFFLDNSSSFSNGTSDSDDSSSTSISSPFDGGNYCQFGFLDAYKWWHCRLALCIGIAGAVANTLTVTTLTRRSMATPTNLLLLGLAIADMLLVVEYIPYNASELLVGEELPQAKGHALYILVHAHLSHVCHTIAIWLTVSLAVWRWYAVCRPHTALTVCTMINARKVLLAVYIACPTLATPTFLMYSVQELSKKHEFPANQTDKFYKIEFSPLALAHDELLIKFNVLVYSVLVKLVPCVLLTLLMPAIIRGMWIAKRRRQRLVNRKASSSVMAMTTSLSVKASAAVVDQSTTANNNASSGDGSIQSKIHRTFSLRAGAKKPVTKTTSVTNGNAEVPPGMKSPNRKNEGATERTTSMLLVVMLLFLLTEAPQGLLAGLSIYYGRDFYQGCYIQLGDPMDLLALINSSINFILYCVMSREFRETFLGMCNSCWGATVSSTKLNTRNTRTTRASDAPVLTHI